MVNLINIVKELIKKYDIKAWELALICYMKKNKSCNIGDKNKIIVDWHKMSEADIQFLDIALDAIHCKLGDEDLMTYMLGVTCENND